MFEELYDFLEKWNNKSTERKFIIMARIMSTLLTVFIVLVIMIDWTDIWGMGNKVWHLRFFNHFFVDGDNKFNWIGITSVLAVISLTFTAWDSRRKMKADLVSKSRIKWMDSLKDSLSSYCSYQQDRLAALHLIYMYSLSGKIKIADFSEKMSVTYDGLVERMNNAGVNTMKYNWLLVLSLHRPKYGEDSYKERILDQIANIEKEITRIQNAQDGDKLASINEQDFVNARNLIKQTNELTAEYLKNEWERAKRGE